MEESDKIKIILDGVSKTLFLPLWERAKINELPSPIINDLKAGEILQRVDFDFSIFENQFTRFNLSWILLGMGVKTKQFDEVIKAFIGKHSNAIIVNIGKG